MAAIPLFAPAVLERICEVLADTSSGLTGSDIGKHLAPLGISDPAPAITKRSRLLEALRLRQEQDRCGNLVAAFIQQTMSPVRHAESKDWLVGWAALSSSMVWDIGFIGFRVHGPGSKEIGGDIVRPSRNITRAGDRAASL